MINPKLLEILACPACSERPPVSLADGAQHLVCDQCGRHYPITDDIPVMLIDEALIPDADGTLRPAPPPQEE